MKASSPIGDGKANDAPSARTPFLKIGGTPPYSAACVAFAIRRNTRGTAIAPYRVIAVPGCRGFAQNASDGVANPVAPISHTPARFVGNKKTLPDLQAY